MAAKKKAKKKTDEVGTGDSPQAYCYEENGQKEAG